MADLRPIEFPEELRHHSLAEQELLPMTPGQQALAKDWNVIKKQTEWTMNQIVVIHNLMVEHDRLLEQWKFWLKTGTLALTGGSGVIYFLMKIANGT